MVVVVTTTCCLCFQYCIAVQLLLLFWSQCPTHLVDPRSVCQSSCCGPTTTFTLFYEHGCFWNEARGNCVGWVRMVTWNWPFPSPIFHWKWVVPGVVNVRPSLVGILTENYAKHTFQSPCCSFESGLTMDLLLFKQSM